MEPDKSVGVTLVDHSGIPVCFGHGGDKRICDDGATGLATEASLGPLEVVGAFLNSSAELLEKVLCLGFNADVQSNLENKAWLS